MFMLLQLPFFFSQPLLFTTAANAVVLFFIKIMLITGALLYLIVSFIMIRQIQIMKSTLITPLSGILQLLGFLHLLFAIGVVFFFIFTL